MRCRKLLVSFVSLYVLVSLLFIGSVSADSEVWSRTYGGDGMDACIAMVQTADGGFALLGYFNASFSGASLLIKTDAHGNMEWNKTIGGGSFIQTLDGGFAFIGANASRVEGYIPVGKMPEGFWSYVCLAKTNEYGNIEWEQTYDEETGYFSGDSLVQTTDGGYALAGHSFSYEGTEDLLLIKTDSYGNKEWSKSYGGSKQESNPKLVQASDGGFALVGTTYSFGEGLNDIWLIKTDAFGNVNWSKTYGGAKMDSPGSLLQLADESFVLAGSTSSFCDEGFDFWLIKTDNRGNVEWNQTYRTKNRSEHNPSLIQTLDGGFALAGYSFTDPLADFLLVRTDSLGKMLWSQIYSGGTVIGMPSLIQTLDGGFALSGGKRAPGSLDTDDFDFWLIKTDENGTPPISTLMPIPTSTSTPTATSSPTEIPTATPAQPPETTQPTETYLIIAAATAAIIIPVAVAVWLRKRK